MGENIGVRDSLQELKRLSQFFRKFVKNPTKVASVVPSSRFLARAIIQDLQLGAGDILVEYGPGTGSFTVELKEKMGIGSIYVGIEQDLDFYKLLLERFPELRFYRGSAEEVLEVLEKQNLGKAKAIVSGLPFVLMPPQTVTHILDSTRNALRDDGVFLTFTYVHAKWMKGANHLRKVLQQCFSRVEMSRVIWRNAPPAIVIKAKK